jgi:GH24 family phage-related lysozyme (muramidase)
MRITSWLLVSAAALIGFSSACSSDLQLVEQGEGLRLCKYLDTMGIPTICYGYNLQNYNARSAIASVGGNYDQVMAGTCLNQNQCAQLLNMALGSARSGAQQVFGSQCPCIQAVLVDMTYNLGVGGVSSFNTFKSLITSHQYAAAASDLKGTAYCSQVGSRCIRNANILSQGCAS